MPPHTLGGQVCYIEVCVHFFSTYNIHIFKFLYPILSEIIHASEFRIRRCRLLKGHSCCIQLSSCKAKKSVQSANMRIRSCLRVWQKFSGNHPKLLALALDCRKKWQFKKKSAGRRFSHDKKKYFSPLRVADPIKSLSIASFLSSFGLFGAQVCLESFSHLY